LSFVGLATDGNGAMTWHVQYRLDTVDHTINHVNPEDAIDTACRLIDDDSDAYGIGTGPLTDSIERDHIVRTYALWVRAKHPFGLTPVGKAPSTEMPDMPHVDGNTLSTSSQPLFPERR
jgi:hypothetical protein